MKWWSESWINLDARIKTHKQEQDVSAGGRARKEKIKKTSNPFCKGHIRKQGNFFNETVGKERVGSGDYFIYKVGNYGN